MQNLLLLADQLVSRLEFIHSRNIIHGNLNPLSFAFGGSVWQKQQVLLVDFNTDSGPDSTARNDLLAVGQILSYFYSSADSWDQYQQQQNQEATAPIFHDAHYDLVLHLEIALDLKGPRVMRDNILPKIGALSAMKNADLFGRLDTTLSHIGQLCGDPTSPLPSKAWPELLDTLDDLLFVYTILISRDRRSSEKKLQVMEAYHLPNRLWRDLQWLLKRTDNVSGALQFAVIGKTYHFIATLYEAYPSSRAFWVRYLLVLARARKDIEPICGKSAWTQAISFWQDVSNKLKSERAFQSRREC
ncbi:casein kinase family protein [Aspergillus tanneri]|uniref:Protein kinase domain-containing protein n=1 Tax=Aspergillus tanneri TaxID=1220188 RepID=A0A5M9M751_9EURO|nr:uncharacterized protein ATNIH1004_011526 [Aspergillus tanneri]KAA8642581.1 hypothetical protein ATNIH1004_011526 [Aspergillus tanneri]